MVTAAPLAEGAVFQIRNDAPENSIVVDLGGDRRVLDSPVRWPTEPRPSSSFPSKLPSR